MDFNLGLLLILLFCSQVCSDDSGFFIRGTSNSQFGSSVALAKNFRGTGSTLVVGAPSAQNLNGDPAGAVFIINPGYRPTGAEFEAAPWNGTYGCAMYGPPGFGSVITVLDLNNDQKMDIAVSSTSQTGTVYVLFGTGGPCNSISLGALDGTNGFVIQNSAQANWVMGKSLGSGYVNNDQYIDLLVGGDGMVLAFAGGVSSAASLGVGNAIATFNGQAANTGIGSENTISSLDASKNVDVNGDLVPDFVLLGPSVQRVYVIYGKSNPVSLTLGLGNINPYGIYMTVASSTIGSVATADIVGDTKGDLIIGDKKLDGELYIFNGQETATNGMVLTPTTLTYKGCTALANVNEDLICNAKAVQAIVRLRKSTLMSSVTLASIQPSALSPSRGDFDGDLSQDLVVGLPLDSQNRGAVYVFWGGVEFPQTFVSIGGCFQPITAWYATQGNCPIPTFHGGTCTASCLDGYVSVNKGATTCLYGNWTTRPCTNRGTYVPATPGSKMLLGTRVLWARRFTGEGDALIISAAAKSAPAITNAGSLLVINPSRDRFIGYEFMETNIVNASVGCILFGSSANMQFGSESVAAVDMNLDGRQDIVIAYQNTTGSFWRIFIIYGKNNFCQFNVNLPDILANPGVNGFALTFPGITSVNSISSGLVNNDDNPDLLICVKPNLIYSVLSGLTYNAAFVNGFPTSGWFSKITGLNSQTAQPRFQTGVGDLTGDGVPDWAVSDAINTRVVVFRGRSAPTTLDINSAPNLANYGIIFTLSGTGGTVGGLIIGDFLGNGSSDLLVQLLAPKSVLYRGPVTAASTQNVWNSNIACNQQSLLGHVAGSPKDDILCIVTGPNGKVSYVTDLQTNSTGTLTYNQGRNWLSPNTGDWDGDGVFDMIVGDRDYNSGDGRGIIVWGSEMHELNNLTKCWAPIAAHHPHAIQGACVQGSPHGTLCQADCEAGWYPKNKTARCFWGYWIFSPCLDRGFWVRRNDSYDLGTTLAWATGFTWNNTLLVGAPGYSAPGLSECGSIFVMPSIGERFSGIEFDSLGLVSGTSGFVINGLAAGDHLGTAMTNLDMNNDGRMDAAVSSDRDGGSVYVIYGNPNFSPTFSLNDLNGAGAGVLGFKLVNPYSSPPSSSFKFGLGLGSGYYDNDNYPDLFVGCGDRILVYSGTAGGTYNANPTGSIVGLAGYFNSLGCKNCFARGADFTGDGVEDFVVIDRTSHLGLIFTGKNQPSTLDLATYGSGPIQSAGGLVYARRIVYNNPPDPDNATTTVTIGHVSGTSAPDIIIGNPQRIFVIEGPSSGAINNGQTSIVLDSTPSYTFGAYGGCSVVRSLGNVAGDSRDDLLCAATGDVLRIKDITSGGVYDTLTGVSGRSLSHGDMDEDGIPDYFIGGVEAGGAATGVYIIWGNINNYPLDMPQLSSCRANVDVNTFYVTNGNCVIPSPHGTTCHIGCIPGYVSIDDEALCWYGEWQALPCKAATCGLFDFNQLPHGDATRSLHCTPGFFGQNCEFACDYGYTPVGSIICDRASGIVAWSTYDAACQPLPCGPPNMGLIARSVPTSSCNSKQVGQTCPYSCQTGYYPDGPLSCVGLTENATDWNYTLAACSAASCGSAIPTVNTIANSNAAASGGKCLGGITSDECVFACQQGYTKVGTLTCDAFSVGVSQWTKNNAACQPIACPNTGPTVQNGVVGDCSNKFTGDICSLTCNSGYSLTSQITCVATGATTTAWSGGNCQAIECDAVNPNLIPHSNHQLPQSCNHLVTSQECAIECAIGYTKSGHLICAGSPTGSAFTYDAVTCTANVCPDVNFTLITHANPASCTGLTTGQSCTFACVEGFKRNGPLQCVGDSETQSHNRWTYESATCEPVSCGNFPFSIIPNSDADTASEHCTNGEAGETCTFSCKLGYHQSDPAVNCTDVDGTGVWVSDGKSCDPFSCGSVDLNQMPNAYAPSTVSCNTLVTGQTCDYTCAEEYEKFGDLNCIGVSTTGSGSVWDYGNTHCAAVSCGKYELCYHPSVNLTTISNECNHGEIGDICSFSCLSGFVINEHGASGDGPITCFSDGVSTYWRGGSHCESKPCPTINPERIPHADPVSIANCQVETIGKSCPIACESGFGATGEIHCVVGSDRDPHLVYPQCLPTPCYDFDLSTIAHYNDELSTLNCDVASPGEHCTFWCEPGWKRVGTITCVLDPQGFGRWQSTAACERLQCPVPDPSQIPHGQWTCGATLPGNQCSYECNDGYTPGGQLQCNELGLELAAWNYSSGPFCHPADCGAFYFSQVSSHAISSLQCTGSKTGDSCGFTCSGTFVATGRISCIPDDSESSHWDYAAATCATQCSPFQVPTHGNSASLSAKCNSGVLDDTCEWNCLPGYTQTVGTTVCTNSGWSNTRACFESTCGPVNLTSLPHANSLTTSSCNSITGGGECEYECAQEYYKSGHLTCVGTPLRWTYEATECIAPSCGAFALCDIPNADQGSAGPHCLQATPGQTCDFKCVDGYRVENGPVTCVSAGGPASWTTNATCTPKPCPVVNPDRISNVNVPSLASCVNLKPGNSCSVTCQPGYGPTGELHCVATPEGNRLVYPQCIATPCTDFDLTSIPFYDDTKPTVNCDVAAQNEACEFECEYGYKKAGSITCTTTSSGVHWTSDASCQQLVCTAPDSSHISHGSFSCGPTGVGDACSYTCNENYIHGGVFSCGLINEEPGWNYDQPFCTACNCANEPELQLIPACSQCSPTAQSACQSCCNYLATSAISPCAYVAFYKAKQSHPNLMSSLESTCSYTLSPECAGNCTDNRQRGLETGVDCGGNCPECPSSIVCTGPDCSTEGKTVGGGSPTGTIVIVVLSIVIAVCCGFLFYFWVIRRRREQEKKRVPTDDPEAASVIRESKNSDLRPDQTELSQFSDPPPLEAAGSGFHGSQY